MIADRVRLPGSLLIRTDDFLRSILMWRILLLLLLLLLHLQLMVACGLIIISCCCFIFDLLMFFLGTRLAQVPGLFWWTHKLFLLMVGKILRLDSSSTYRRILYQAVLFDLNRHLLRRFVACNDWLHLDLHWLEFVDQFVLANILNVTHLFAQLLS